MTQLEDLSNQRITRDLQHRNAKYAAEMRELDDRLALERQYGAPKETDNHKEEERPQAAKGGEHDAA